jgi:signal transduction histidine kinase
VEDVRSTLAVLAENRGIDLITEVDPDLPETLYGDSQRLKQILVNLANNAIKFTNEGYVAVRVFRPGNGQWAMVVSDTGVGIPEEAREYIFDPFRQVDSSMTREHKGTGMGLAIVKQLAQLMGGSVSLESALGQGSTFTVLLPLTQPQGGVE